MPYTRGVMKPAVMIAAIIGLGAAALTQSRPAGPVTVTAAQANLLSQEARAVADRRTQLVKSLGTLETAGPFSEQKKTLIAGVESEVSAVRRTRERFTPSADQRAAADTFFDDWARQYTTISNQLAGLEPAAYPPARDGTIRLLSDNEKAYATVAGTRSLTFDLLVTSTPAGASVEFKREGDRDYERNPDLTNATLKNLVRAIWIVRATRGAEAQEKTYNPFRDPNNVLHFDFKP
jgi:hypothetical protein